MLFLDLRTFKIVYIVHWIYLWFYFVSDFSFRACLDEFLFKDK